MEAYTSFARVYDMFMDNVPYEVWGRYIVEKTGVQKWYRQWICRGLERLWYGKSLPRFLQMVAMI